jgi:hypothetical protein
MSQGLLTSIVVPAITAFVTAFLTFLVQERKLRRDYMLEFMAENVARELLESKKWEKRSFGAIKATPDRARCQSSALAPFRFSKPQSSSPFFALKLTAPARTNIFLSSSSSNPPKRRHVKKPHPEG